MPHGITLHLALKNSNCTIFSEELLHTWQHQLLLIATSSRPFKKALLHFSCHCWCTISQPPCLYLVHSQQLSFNEDSSLFLLGKPPGNLGTNYYAKNQLLAWNSTSTTQHTTPKVPAPHQGCSTAHRGSEGTNDSSSTSYCWRWCSSRDLRSFDRSILINLLGITILLWLSPNKPGMTIYIINQMLFLTLTSNNTKWCAHTMSPNDQLSSSIDSSLRHLQLQQVTMASLFQPQWV